MHLPTGVANLPPSFDMGQKLYCEVYLDML